MNAATPVWQQLCRRNFAVYLMIRLIGLFRLASKFLEPHRRPDAVLQELSQLSIPLSDITRRT